MERIKLVFDPQLQVIRLGFHGSESLFYKNKNKSDSRAPKTAARRAPTARRALNRRPMADGKRKRAAPLGAKA